MAFRCMSPRIESAVFAVNSSTQFAKCRDIAPENYVASNAKFVWKDYYFSMIVRNVAFSSLIDGIVYETQRCLSFMHIYTDTTVGAKRQLKTFCSRELNHAQ
jgi:hypothetical protein